MTSLVRRKTFHAGDERQHGLREQLEETQKQLEESARETRQHEETEAAKVMGRFVKSIQHKKRQESLESQLSTTEEQLQMAATYGKQLLDENERLVWCTTLG